MKILLTSLLFATGMLLGLAAQAEDTVTAPLPAIKKDPPTETTAPAPPPAEQAPKTKPAKVSKPRRGKPRPKNMDLRHCLELPTNAEIAACAGE